MIKRKGDGGKNRGKSLIKWKTRGYEEKREIMGKKENKWCS